MLVKTALLPSFLLEESYPVAQRSLLPSRFLAFYPLPPSSTPRVPAACLRFLNPEKKLVDDFGQEATVSSEVDEWTGETGPGGHVSKVPRKKGLRGVWIPLLLFWKFSPGMKRLLIQRIMSSI